ncbi:isochorismatase family protein [Tropicibacter naphthalenivorans]|uniref:Maleamate amidohydrolase n=1 Tax=Tropicibacter naphthalenivorans TaxID=441103 RepID=A0A0P1G9V5_9RHOB|nr:isochorismatase family protein [Tropicibacter naphthalenivorans]CUH78222.1 Maleamate amidohydrolase [Tropicibacter naphthalenivorans]SMC78472.1 Nicotinamidase-related amidase [Tropicibacter naphthalenivorans]
MRAPVHDKLTLPEGKVALLLIDIQQEARQDPDYTVAGIEDVVANAARLLGAARAAGIPVGHACYVRDHAIAPPRAFEPVAADGAPTFSDARSELTAICPELAPLDGEAVFVKQDASAFYGTDLLEWFADIEWLVIAGTWTDACIAATVRDATRLGYRALLVKDAIGSGTELMHQTGILNLANRLYGGGVCDTARAETLLGGGSAPVWRVVDPVPLLYTAETVQALYDSL